ncbi:ubiquitin-conjugating enzyme [Lentinus brumalis]|uniref:Ubiquitin-conjugating enzyme n=1 Tax=Lentinus brumalis TaxID=2498619 RepID=A0A371DJH3_9APHY|nr:ubiquitin-conjugating enzyme [Polyporus brumalis]
MTALRRIQKELKDINNNPLDGVTIEPLEDNLFQWKCAIKAASNSPYKGGTFHFTLTLPENFPFKPPSVCPSFPVLYALRFPGVLHAPFSTCYQVTFTTKIYHPGINEEGHICVPVLRDQWKPTVTLSSVLSTIQEKLNNPSPDDPFEPDIAALMKNDEAKFLATAKEWTKKYAQQ